MLYIYVFVFGRYEKSTAVDACTYFENFAALQFREQFENSIIFRFAVENGRFFWLNLFRRSHISVCSV